MNTGDASQYIVHLVTKPLSPPWIDSARNLPRYLVEYATGTAFRIMISDADSLGKSGENQSTWFCSRSGKTVSATVFADPIYKSSCGLSVSPADRVRALIRLAACLNHSRSAPYTSIFHFFFTPNPPTSLTMRFLTHLNPAAPTVQTVTSCPLPHHNLRRLCFTRRIVALSTHTRSWLKNVLNRSVDLIPPGIPVPPALTAEEMDSKKKSARNQLDLPDCFLVLYAGDLQDSGCMPIWRTVLPEWRSLFPGIRVVFAIRDKHPADRRCLDELRKLGGSQVIVAGVVREMAAMIDACDAMVFPVISLRSKMDIPMVVLEAMAHQKPVLLSAIPELKDLTETGGVIKADPYRSQTFTSGLAELMKSREYIHHSGMNARDCVIRNFNVASMASAYEGIYQAEFERSNRHRKERNA